MADLPDPVAQVQRMGSYQGVPAYGCLLTIEAEKRLKVNDPLFAANQLRTYAAAQVAEAVAAERAESARLRQLLNLARDDYNTAAQRLQDIGDYAHDHSTGPAVPDALWEVRSMAYGSGA